MLFISAILTVLVASVFAETEKNHHGKSNKACTRELENIVYTPDNCAFNYLKKITADLRIQAPLLNTLQNASVLDSFRANHGVDVLVVDALGIATDYVYNTNALALANAVDTSTFSTVYERSMALGEAFAVDTYASTVSYASLFWGPDGSVHDIIVSMDLNDAPQFC